uniref:Uncharacterized protein n=1 Tax=Cryptomonas curvata TaxID=233186 RepID=A0A7S0QCX8_9CRYP|eukprot:CAMPEP_0172153828 /NCGR_PEP_ID=MMETSP1050-20130122/1681_1 /TAXON_ID=233186 /ORGANISM="Cryptomonas curvata, Strain CCAP979/52" /LENGTH=340 /DNA_ID=CAMNT_0012822447 /DNA_START=40 /DNA_END=1062 /DNA_ORIENTATION=-
MTTADVFNKFIIPATKERKIAYVDLIREDVVPDAWDEGFQPAVGRSNYFASHAWLYRFKDFVGAVTDWAGQNLRREQMNCSYFWVDIFTVNQHTPKADDFWDIAFAEGVKQVGHTVLVLQPHQNPIPFRRIWCIWEIFSTIKQGVALSVAMKVTEKNSFCRACRDDFNEVLSALQRIDAEDAEAAVPDDKARILDAVVKTAGGMAEFNKTCRLAMISMLLIEMAREGRKNEVSQLLDLGVDPNGGACPAIHEASYDGNLELVQLLVSHGGNPDQRDSAGWTPISCACEGGHLELVTWFVEKCKVDLHYRDWDGNRPLENAERYGQLEVAGYLRKKTALAP